MNAHAQGSASFHSLPTIPESPSHISRSLSASSIPSLPSSSTSGHGSRNGSSPTSSCSSEEPEDLPNFDGVYSPPASPKPKAKPLPSTSPSLTPTGISGIAPPISAHPYARPSTTRRQTVPRGLSPLAPLSSLPLGQGVLPKSQSLARTVLNRHDAPHAGLGLGASGKKGKTKLIVATKPFKTTFELGLTASEFARKA